MNSTSILGYVENTYNRGMAKYRLTCIVQNQLCIKSPDEVVERSHCCSYWPSLQGCSLGFTRVKLSLVDSLEDGAETWTGRQFSASSEPGVR